MTHNANQVLGIDLGTSGLKVVLMNEIGQIIDTEKAELTISRLFPGWSEQDPEAWWQSLKRVLTTLSKRRSLRHVRSLGISGQMHGSVLLDSDNVVIRPAILWNDARCEAECHELKVLIPAIEKITGNEVMVGFTAPKLLWLKKHEPEAFRRIAHIMLPKDFLVWRLTGTFVTDSSDAAGTLWFDVKHRQWSRELIEACGLRPEQLPRVHNGSDVIGQLHPELADMWGMDNTVLVVAGAGDNAAGAVGSNINRPGELMMSLGTSGVSFLLSEHYSENTSSGIHRFCHTLPGRWSLMAVTLNAASCLQWAAGVLSCKDVPELMSLADKVEIDEPELLFLPYLSGERTPLNNPSARGVFFGLDHSHSRDSLARAVVEGVSFALAEGLESLSHSQPLPESLQLIGGGARSAFWRQLLADITGCKIKFRNDGDVGPARGAAILALCGFYETTDISQFFIMDTDEIIISHPTPEKSNKYNHRQARFRRLYSSLKPLYAAV